MYLCSCSWTRTGRRSASTHSDSVRIQHAVHRRQMDRRGTPRQVVPRDRPRARTRSRRDRLITNFTSSCGRSRSRLLQSFFSASPLPGHFTSMMVTTPAGTRAVLRWPPVSSSTVFPRSSSRSISGYTSSCSSGSPPVTSTSGQRSGRPLRESSRPAACVPSWNAYGVSHHEQRGRTPSGGRTHTAGRRRWTRPAPNRRSR